MPKYSFIIPVYNRPNEIQDLISSLEKQTIKKFEVIVVDDGSENRSEKVLEKTGKNFKYFFKQNEGPGPTRNFGAAKASGEWLIFLDSDCFLPDNYLVEIDSFLSNNQVDAFGGPDKDHESFTPVQKAISFSMTSFLTTGGIRGKRNSLEKFKPRSFNMGIKKELFGELGGFSKLRFGEDIDLSLRILEKGSHTALIENAFVYHKRRVSFRQFFKQIYNSGIARIVLNDIHPNTLKLVHLLPLAFFLGHLAVLVCSLIYPKLIIPIILYVIFVFLTASIQFKNLWIGFLCIASSYTQLFSYAMGFLHAYWTRYILRRQIKHAYLDNFYE